MSQVDDLKAIVTSIRKDLKKLGPERVVALSVHKEKELIIELEAKVDKVLQQLEGMS